jgi:hypothetical protein
MYTAQIQEQDCGSEFRGFGPSVQSSDSILKIVRIKVCSVPIFSVRFVLWDFLCPGIRKGRFIPQLWRPQLIVDSISNRKCCCHLFVHSILHSILNWLCVIAFLKPVVDNGTSINLLIKCFGVLFPRPPIFLLPLLIRGIPIAGTSPNLEF